MILIIQQKGDDINNIQYVACQLRVSYDRIEIQMK